MYPWRIVTTATTMTGLPIDEGHRQDGPDRDIIKKVVALVLCLLVIIGACVAILYVL